ncbi:MAG: S41 family peptidase [Deltaproteobacteria bacterium]|nr:S41 family peptidase [Deltaproteobacteria bacterium]
MVIRKPFRFGFSLLICFIFLVSGSLGYCADSTAKYSPDYKELKLFRQVMEIVRKNYVKEVTDKELIQGAISGMLQSLDPHSSYLTEDMFKELQVETKGEFGGLGIEITLDGGILTVVSPIEDTPAFKAGIKPGDKIIKINGEPTKNITLHSAVKQMRGPRGTKVTLTIMREGFKKFKDFAITRDIIHVHSVKKQPIEFTLGFDKIVSFQETTDTDLMAAIKELENGENTKNSNKKAKKDDDHLKGLILDLRNDPGGLLDQAVKVSNLFIDKGLIVYTDGRVKDQRMEFRASPAGTHYKFKVAVLINEGSASASEIVSGALQDHDRALIFGTKSFGKASVQTIIPLDNGSGLRLTTAYYYTPKGRHIQKTGILPDVNMKAEIQKKEEEEAAAEEANKNGKKNDKQSRFNKETKVDIEKDIVAKKALEWLKSDVSVKKFKQEHEKQQITDTTAMKR